MTDHGHAGVVGDQVEDLHDIDVVQGFKNHAHSEDLLYSGYYEDDVLKALNEQTVRVTTLRESDEEGVVETEDEKMVPETEDEKMVPETDDERMPPPPPVQVVPETEDEGDEGIDPTPPSQRLMRRRRPSERITKRKLAARISGAGESSEAPMSLE